MVDENDVVPILTRIPRQSEGDQNAADVGAQGHSPADEAAREPRASCANRKGSRSGLFEASVGVVVGSIDVYLHGGDGDGGQRRWVTVNSKNGEIYV